MAATSVFVKINEKQYELPRKWHSFFFNGSLEDIDEFWKELIFDGKIELMKRADGVTYLKLIAKNGYQFAQPSTLILYSPPGSHNIDAFLTFSVFDPSIPTRW